MYTGYIDDLRISNIARYSGETFSLPTEAHVADSNTLTLLRMEQSQLNITLPPSPVANDVINIWDIGGQCETNPVHLLGNGKKISSRGVTLNVDDILALDSNSFFATLVYKDTTHGWLLVP
ncbi:uncharacterized protein METZ01_LOCUS382172 [marine metagenome]|uniref:Uncharacterized protein n=1 Tax=marine metagenome TaxID=408172 RepID=A0A382U6M7_9ZZZZ